MSDSEDEEDCEDGNDTIKQSNCSSRGRTADDEEWDFNFIPEPHPGIRRSKRILQQIRGNEKEGLHRIAAVAAKEAASIPNLTISNSNLTKGWTKANQNLQLEEWAFQDYFADAIIVKTTGESLEYRELIKRPETRETWFRSLANEIGRLARGIRDIKGTDTIFFIPKYEIPKERLKEVTYAIPASNACKTTTRTVKGSAH